MVEKVDDKLPVELAAGMAKNAQHAQYTDAPFSYAPTDQGEIDDARATVAGAVQSLVSAGVKPDDLDPSFGDIVGAEFRQNNLVASALSSNVLGELALPTEDAKPLTHADIISMVEKENLQPYFNYFKGARTDAEFEAIRADLEREQADQRIQAAAGWTGTGVGLVAGIADVPSLLPGAIAVKGLAKAPSLMRAAIETGLGGAAAGVASEVGLEASQVTRQQEGIAPKVERIGAATALGAILGGSIHAMIGPEAADKVVQRYDAARSGNPAAAGASPVDVYSQLSSRGLDDDDRLNGLGAFTALEKMGDLPFIGQWLRNPALDSQRSPSRAVRDTMETLANTGAVTKRNANQVRSRENVEALMTKYPGIAVDVEAEINQAWQKNKATFAGNRGDFNKRIMLAIVDGGRAEEPAIKQAADAISDRVFAPMQKELVADGHFDDEPDIKNAVRYAPIVYDAHSVRAQKDDFISEHIGEFEADIHQQATDALKAKESLASDIEDAVIENFGVQKKVGKVDETGAPVINPKTGKQVQETVTVKPGTVGEARRELMGQAKLDLEHNTDSRDEALRAFENNQQPTRVDHHEQFRARDEAQDKKVNVEGVRDDKIKDIEADLKSAKEKREEKYNKAVINANLKKDKVRILTLERDADLKKLQARADEQIAKAKAAAQKELDKLDAQIEKSKKEVRDYYEQRAEEIRTERDAQINRAVENAHDRVSTAKASDLYDEDGFEQLLKKYVRDGEVDKDLVSEAAHQRAEALYKSVTGQTRYVFGHDVQGVAGYRKARSNPNYHANMIRKGWVEADPLKAMNAYARAAGTDIALGKLFRKMVPKRDEFGKIVKSAEGKTEMVEVADPKMSEAKARIKSDYDNLLSNVTVPPKTVEKLKQKYAGKPDELDVALKKTRADLEKKMMQQKDRDIANVELLTNALRGKTSGGEPGPNTMHTAAELFGIFNFVTKMGGVVVSSLGDPINIALSQGFGNAAKYGLVPLIKAFRESYWAADSELRKMSRLALANTEMEHGSRLMSMGDVGNIYSSKDFMERPRQIAETFGKVSGITYWNDFAKQISYNTIQARLIDMAGRGMKNLNAADQTWLHHLGLDADTLDKIAAEYANQSEKFAANIPIARFDQWADQGVAERFRQAAYQESTGVVVSPTASNRLALASTPLGRIIFQFRNFMIANQMRLIGKNVQLAMLSKEKAASVYTGLFGLVLMSAFIDAAKRVIANSDVEGSLSDESQWTKYLEDWEKKPGQQLYNTLDRSGHFGVLFEGSNILDKLGLPSIQGGLRMATGEDVDPENAGTSRTHNQDIFGAAFGPTAGLLSDISQAGGSASSGLAHMVRGIRGNDTELDDYHFSRGDYKRIVRQVPGSSIFWLRPFINSGQRAAGNYFDWPDPQ